MPEEPKLDEESAQGLASGISEFNAGLFFECHDTLEDLWHGTRGPARDFFQGLIQVAVGFYHLGNSNTTGGRSQFGKAMRNLDSYGREYLRVDLDALRADVREWIRKIDAGEPLQRPMAELPKIRRRHAENREDY
jgi:uncharacterized protein